MKNRQPHIKIWQFSNAPEEYKELSTNGGDEDWIAFIPDEMDETRDAHLGFLEEGTPFGWCCVNEHLVPNGRILIGCHA
jgi:hypothetical protein